MKFRAIVTDVSDVTVNPAEPRASVTLRAATVADLVGVGTTAEPALPDAAGLDPAAPAATLTAIIVGPEAAEFRIGRLVTLSTKF